MGRCLSSVATGSASDYTGNRTTWVRVELQLQNVIEVELNSPKLGIGPGGSLLSPFKLERAPLVFQRLLLGLGEVYGVGYSVDRSVLDVEHLFLPKGLKIAPKALFKRAFRPKNP